LSFWSVPEPGKNLDKNYVQNNYDKNYDKNYEKHFEKKTKVVEDNSSQLSRNSSVGESIFARNGIFYPYNLGFNIANNNQNNISSISNDPLKQFVNNHNIISTNTTNINFETDDNDILMQLNNDNRLLTPDINSNNSFITNNSSFVGYKSNEPMNIDLNKFISSTNPDTTIHDISTSNDLPIIQEVKFYLEIVKRPT
jgi:hypothetical protein